MSEEKISYGKVDGKVHGNIMELLPEVRGGDMVFELSEEVQNLIAAVRETGKVGKIKLTLKVSPLNKGNADSVKIEDSIDLTLPKPDKKMTIFFTNDKNQLLRDDPKQMKFAFEKKSEK